MIRNKRISISEELLNAYKGKTFDYLKEGFYVELASMMSKFNPKDDIIVKLREERQLKLLEMPKTDTSPFDLAMKMRNQDKMLCRKLEKILLKKEEKRLKKINEQYI